MPTTKAPKKQRPAQAQAHQPGSEAEMSPPPQTRLQHYRASGKLDGKVALITGGDSGIGRAVAVLFAREGADIAFAYLDEHEDAAETKLMVEAEGRRCLAIAGDLGDEQVCREAVLRTVNEFERLDVLVNNAAEQHPQDDLLHISEEQLTRTFRTNIFSFFFMAKACLKHLDKGSAIINTASVVAYRGSPNLIDYAATKGAIIAFTRSLALSLTERQVRVNAVAPGPVWTPLIAATFPADKVATFGSTTPMGRAAEPGEIAPSYVFLASSDSTYMTGQVLHPNGGEIING